MNLTFLTQLLSNISTPDGKPDYRKLIFPAVSIIASIAIFFLLVVPQVIQLTDNQNTLNDLKSQIDNLGTKVASLNTISTPEFESNLEIATKALPNLKDYIDSTPYIQEAIDTSGVSLSALSFSEAPPSGEINSYQVKIDVEGNLTQINQFLNLVNRSPRELKVTRIELSNSAQSAYTATVTISAYYSPVQKQNLTLTQPVVNLSDQELQQIFNLGKNLKNIKTKDSSGQVGRSDPFN